FNAAAELKLPLSLTIIEETDELLPVDDRISMHFMNKLLNEISLTENIYQCEAGDYAGLCRIFEEGTGVCRKQKVPVLFHIRQNTSAGNAELSDAVLSMRHWIIQIRLATSGEIEKLEHQADRKAEEIRKKAARECMRLGIKLI
ncbi:MAG: hypothetical protein KJ607_14600, partial [Bacteroidetes bacterium]|nr:hypothetical protein [Bacteroidota bacterium]